MIVITDEATYGGQGSVVALGMFDGVHMGHRALIRRAVQMAHDEKLDCVVCTFDRHPLSVLSPEREPEELMTIGAKLDIFSCLGADIALVKPFTKEFSRVPADMYIENLVKCLRARVIVAGENYTFGYKGLGNAKLLIEMSKTLDYRPEILSPVTFEGTTVSSTLIRKLLREGDSALAAKLLGD